MMYIEVDALYLAQLNKPENYAKLEAYRDDKDKSGAKFAQYTVDLFNMLRDTPAWEKPGTNEMLNEVLSYARAIMTKAKKGKTSAFAHAGRLIRSIDYHKYQQVYASYTPKVKLLPELSEEELQQLALV